MTGAMRARAPFALESEREKCASKEKESASIVNPKTTMEEAGARCSSVPGIVNVVR
jgi:hypothetical protein